MCTTHCEPVIEVVWTGPYCWPEFEIGSNSRPLPRQPGVYLQTVEYQDGYLIYCAGLTRRSMPTRFREHTRKYMSGDYTVLDIAAMQLEGFRIFVANVGTGPRILERLEASIICNLYEQPSPFCDIPDRGMMLSPRWDSEAPIIAENKCTAQLHGLPPRMEI